jgi:hypothetical protein
LYHFLECRLAHLTNPPEQGIAEVQLVAHVLDGKLAPLVFLKRRWPSNDNAFVTRDIKFSSNANFYVKLSITTLHYQYDFQLYDSANNEETYLGRKRFIGNGAVGKYELTLSREACTAQE